MQGEREQHDALLASGMHRPKRNWGAGVATDSPVAGLRSAGHALRPDCAFWFRRLATPVLPEGGARFRGLLHAVRPKTRAASRFRSVRIVRGRSSLRERSIPRTRRSMKSRACSGRSALRLRFRRTVPVEPPEGTSPFPACSIRLARRLPRYRSGRRGLTRRPTSIFRSGRRGRARSSEESQQPGHRRPYEVPMPKHLSFASLPRCLSRLPGCPAR